MSETLRTKSWPDITGADSGNDDVEDKNKNLDPDDDDEDPDDDDPDDDDDDDEETVESLTKKLADAETARKQAERRMKRADRSASKAQAELATLKNGGAKELSDAQAEIEKLNGQLAKLQGTDTVTAIREDFRDLVGAPSWHNPKLAFSLLDLKEVDVDDDGNVDQDSLKDAVAALAKKHPYLVKTADKQTEDEDDSDAEPKPKSGTPAGGRRKPNPKAARKSTLEAKYRMGGRVPTP